MQYHASFNQSSAMNRLVAALTGVCSLVAVSSVSHAAAIGLDLTTAVLIGGAGTIDDGSKIEFDSNTSGETATFTLSSVPGTQYLISVTGQHNQSSWFLQFLIYVDGTCPAGLCHLCI